MTRNDEIRAAQLIQDIPESTVVRWRSEEADALNESKRVC
jgi:hypothetical protein